MVKGQKEAIQGTVTMVGTRIKMAMRIMEAQAEQ